jgi:hypothetical protein
VNPAHEGKSGWVASRTGKGTRLLGISDAVDWKDSLIREERQCEKSTNTAESQPPI